VKYHVDDVHAVEPVPTTNDKVWKLSESLT
jgi:hypothetical protein